MATGLFARSECIGFVAVGSNGAKVQQNLRTDGPLLLWPRCSTPGSLPFRSMLGAVLPTTMSRSPWAPWTGAVSGESKPAG